jgi:iron complex outermembrane receptor protein
MGMKRFLLASIGVGAIATATAATAQERAPVPAQGTASRSSTESDAGIGDIIVTASRRAESAQRSALSIQALSSEDLARANVTKPEDLSAIAPGVAVGTGGNVPQVYIRGIGNFGTGPLAEGAVAFNLDGVYIARAQTTRGMFYDLERVEMLKGPQGTLYGRNASGGAINVITAKPKLGERSGFVDLQGGNYSTIQAAAAVNLPLGDNLAIRASGQTVHHDGYLSDGYDDEITKSARLQLYWKPSTDLSLLINGNFQKVEGNGAGAVLKPQLPGDAFRGASDPAVTAIIAAQPGIGAFLVAPQTDGFIDFTTYAVGAELNWNLGFATLTVLPAYREAKLRDLTYVPGFSVAGATRDRQISLETRLGNDGPDLKWVLGGYFFDQKTDDLPGKPQQVAAQGVSTFIIEDLNSSVRSYAAFGQATLRLADRFRVTGGLRYTYERKRLSEFLTNYSLPAPPPAPAGTCRSGFFDFLTPTPPRFCHLDIDLQGANSQELTYNNVTWKAGVEFDIAERSMAYANVSTGFKSGGFFSAPPPNTFRPEKLTAFEAGIKNRFLDNRLQVNIEAFYWKYKDHQETIVGPTSIPGFYAQLTSNAGRAKSYGADLDVLFQATPQDEFSFKVQYNKTNYDSFVFTNQTNVFGAPVTGCDVGPLQGNGSQVVDCTGKPLMRAPEWTGSASYRHDFELADGATISASADVQFSSSYYLSVDFLESARQSSFAVGNFDLTYTSSDRRLTASAFVSNIWNEAVYTQAFRYPFVSPANPLANPDGVILGTLRPPRTFGARIRVNF